MRKLGPLFVLLFAFLAACHSDETPAGPDMRAPDHLCFAIACDSNSSCPQANSRCVITEPGQLRGGCTNGESTCGVHLAGDCGFTARCLDAHTLGKPFVAKPEGGCGIERIGCGNGCVDGDADGGVGVGAHCQ